MCMIDGCDDFVTVLSAKWRVARKAHKCGECAREIAPGERYYAEVGVIAHGMDFYKTCRHCHVVREWLRAECGGFVYEFIAEDMHEHIQEAGWGYHFDVRKLAIGIGRQWKRCDGTMWPVPAMAKTTHERKMDLGPQRPQKVSGYGY